MKLRIAAPLALAVIASGAQAQTYRSDSGTIGAAVGISGTGGNFAWMETFVVSGGNSVITGISACFGGGTMSGLTLGQSFRVFVWKGTPTGSGADAPTLLASATGAVASISLITGNFQDVPISASITGTSNFFIGVAVDQAQGGFPGPLQTAGTAQYPILPNSWSAGSTTMGGFDPNNLNGGIGLFHGNPAGNWLVRADAVPEPASMAALGMGALALLRRRSRGRR